MTKAKAVKTPAATEKQPAAAAKKPAKPAAKAAKPAAAPAEAEKPVKTAAAEKSVKPVAKPPSKPSAKAKGKTASHETERMVKPGKPQPLDEPTPQAEARQPDSVAPQTTDSGRFRFGGSGLGIKTAPKKPGLTAAPGVMLLNRPAPAKPEASARPSERRLGKKEQQEIRSFLLEKRERLIAGMRRELAMQKERADSKAADEVDKATDAYDEDLSFEIATANDQELGEIQVALEKIEKGTYGECEICGCAISLSRLKVLPSATTCVSCRGQEELARRRDEPGPSFLMAEDAETEAGPL